MSLHDDSASLISVAPSQLVGRSLIEPLERRVLFATASFTFPGFASTANLVTNGFGAAPVTSGTALRLTDGGTDEARSVWYGTEVPVKTFTSHFSFRLKNATADGMTFTLHGGSTSELGTSGAGLGYAGIDESVAVAFNFYNSGLFGSKSSFATNGDVPANDKDTSPLNLHTRHLMQATVSYDGTTLELTVRDATDGSSRFNASMDVDLHTLIGKDTATVGFTAATSSLSSIQDVLSWRFVGNGPTIDKPAEATPVTGKSSTLSASGKDPEGDELLTYTWSVLRRPTGARQPTFSVNGTTDAKSTIASFSKDGNYRLLCTITDEDGSSAVTSVLLQVQQTPTSVRVTPPVATVRRGQSVPLSASAFDQFGRPMRTAPQIFFAIESGDGVIDQTTGVYTASGLFKEVVIAAFASAAVSGTARVTVT